MKGKRRIIVLLVMVLFSSALSSVYADTGAGEDSKNYVLHEISESWASLSDEELNDYFGNNNESEIYWFLISLTEQEREMLLSKDTMLNNEIYTDNGNGTFAKSKYYDWIMENQEIVLPSRFNARNIVSEFTAKSGYCFFQFVDAHSGYTVIYKVTFTLDSTNNAESEKNNYTVSSVIYKTSGSNSNGTSLNSVTFEKEKTYMQKANTSYEVLGDGTTGKNSNGDTIYRTAITPVFVLKVNVKKPAYTYGGWTVNDFQSQGVNQTMASGSRLNFREYNWQNTGNTTFNTYVYHSEVTDTLTANINILSCGFDTRNADPALNLNRSPEHDTINVVYRRPTLSVKLHPNGGDVSATAYNPDAANPKEHTVFYNNVYDSRYGLADPSSAGFSKTGYKAVSKKEWKNSDGSKTWDTLDTSYKATDFQDFTDGTYFTSKTKDLYVNWEANVYEVILDNQGADYSGTENVWYRYNTYDQVTLDDGTLQKNYYYTTKALGISLQYGYRIIKPEKEGYEFKGYYTAKQGQGTQYVNASGDFINSLWKTIGPHTLYAHWEKKAEETGKLIIRRNLARDDYYSTHGNATFIFKIRPQGAGDKEYYRYISFKQADMSAAKDGVVTLETECSLPYGEYTVETVDVSRFTSSLTSITKGSSTSGTKGAFKIEDGNKEVIAVYGGIKDDWQRFSHNNLVVNNLK